MKIVFCFRQFGAHCSMPIQQDSTISYRMEIRSSWGLHRLTHGRTDWRSDTDVIFVGLQTPWHYYCLMGRARYKGNVIHSFHWLKKANSSYIPRVLVALWRAVSSENALLWVKMKTHTHTHTHTYNFIIHEFQERNRKFCFLWRIVRYGCNWGVCFMTVRNTRSKWSLRIYLTLLYFYYILFIVYFANVARSRNIKLLKSSKEIPM
jgi:hypothetical protein